MLRKPQHFATFIGYSALIFWAMSPVLATIVKNIPTLQILSTAFAISFGLTALVLTIRKEWYKIKQPVLLWVVGMVGVYGNDMLYIAAFKHAPPAQIDLINYLWPILVILFAGFLPREQFTYRHVLAGLLGFLGAFVLITGGKGLGGFHSEYLKGYILAFFDAVVWSIYTLVARHYGKTPVEMIGMYCGMGFVLSIISHFSLEATVMPTGEQWVVLIIMGVTTQGLAYFFWDFGVKRGDFKLLSVLTYANPILSILLLIAFGLAVPSAGLAMACVFVTLAGVVCGVDFDLKKAIRALIYYKYVIPRESGESMTKPLGKHI